MKRPTARVLVLCLCGAAALALGALALLRTRELPDPRALSRHLKPPAFVAPLVTLAAHQYRTRSVAFSPDGNRLATAGDDWIVKVWRLPSGAIEREISDETHHLYLTGAYNVRFSRDGTVIGTGGTKAYPGGTYYGAATIYDSLTGEELALLKCNPNGRCVMAFSRDGTHVATADDGGLTPATYPGEVRLWSGRGDLLLTFEGHRGGYTAIAYSPDGALIATGGHDGFVRLWSVADRKQVAALVTEAGLVTQVVFSASGEEMASAGGDRRVRIWRLPGGTHQRSFPCCRVPISVRFLRNDKVLAVADVIYRGSGSHVPTKNLIRFWEVSSGRDLGALATDPDPARPYSHEGIHAIDVSRDGRLIASAHEGGKVQVWELEKLPIAWPEP